MSRKKGDNTAYSAIGDTQHRWEPGLSKLPWRGLTALVLAVAGVVVAFIVLAVSNGDEVRHWKFQPTVYIAIASTVTNIAVTYALFEGVTVAFWAKAMKDGTTVANLHHIWDFGTSFISALLCGRHINLIAIASLLVAISPVNGPLYQRATTIGNVGIDRTQQLSANIAKLIPEGYTGVHTGRGTTVNMLTSNFSTIARNFYNRAPIHFESACIDSCKARIYGAGFRVNCSSYHAPFDANPQDEGNGSYYFPAPAIFGTYFLYDAPSQPISASLGIQYKSDIGCAGHLVVRNCSLTVGTMGYDVVIDGRTSTISLAPESTIWDDVAIGPSDNLTATTTQGLSTYGGLYLSLANRLTNQLQLHFGGGIGYEYFGTQSEVSISYARNIGADANCNVTFIDPTADYLQDIRSLMFRTAIGSANDTDRQEISATATGSHTIYQTNYIFVGLATFASILPIMVVLFTFRGVLDLGREVSLSPMEIARAFGAPILRGSNSNAPAKSLLKQVGYRPVKYGVVRDHRVSSQSSQMIRRKPVSTHYQPHPAYSDHPTGHGDISDNFMYDNEIPANGSAHQRSGSDYNVHRRQESYHNSPLQHQQPGGDHYMSGANHPAWQSGFDSDMELMDPIQRAGGARAWLEIADPKNVESIEKGMVFSNG